jgi:prepilin-type N-terminal cleavage/methylation domain-containing protein/prepilin-type processing-associated H-X9-DG protein
MVLSSRWRRAFTLVELLVVIAIIGILVALLLPAVQAAREAGRRTQCNNNLKQIGLALQNHHDTYRRLPPGAACDQAPFGPANQGAYGAGQWGSSWMVYLLPFIEQSAMYDNWQFYNQSGVFNSNNITVRSGRVIAGYDCPSSPLPDFCNSQTTTATASYVGIAGAANGLIPNYTESRIDSATNYGFSSGSGTLFPNAKLNLSALTDGTSNTFAVSEQSSYLFRTDGSQVDWRGSQPWGWAIGVKGPGTPPNFYNPPGGDNRTFNQTTILYAINQKRNWGSGNGTCSGVGVCLDYGQNIPLNSAHPGGVNALFNDGSVHFLSQTIPLVTLAELATRDDGMPVGEF